MKAVRSSRSELRCTRATEIEKKKPTWEGGPDVPSGRDRWTIKKGCNLEEKRGGRAAGREEEEEGKMVSLRGRTIGKPRAASGKGRSAGPLPTASQPTASL